MEMVRSLLFASIVFLSPLMASAEGFSLAIGPPVAAGAGVKVMKAKGVEFAVRLEECADLDKARINGTAEAIVNGARTSTPVTFSAVGSPGVYVVSQANGRNADTFVVTLSATCGNATAGAIVPMGPTGIQRDGIKNLPRAATNAEVEAALKFAGAH